MATADDWTGETVTLKLQCYVFKYRDVNGNVQTVEVYAVDDETAAFLFERTHGKTIQEILS